MTTTGRPGSRADELLADWADLAGRARRPDDAPMERRPAGLRAVAAMAGPMVVGLLIVLLVGVSTRMLPEGPPDGRLLRVEGLMGAPTIAPGDACPVTAPNGVPWPRAGDPSGGAFGAEGLVVRIEPDGHVGIPPAQRTGGLLWAKLGVWRDAEAAGTLSLSGRRLDGAGGTFESQVPDGYGATGLQIAGIGFSSFGCWELTARSGQSEMRWVVLVEAVPDPDPAACLATVPNGAHTEAWPASDLDHGEGGLFTVLWPGGAVQVPVSEVDREGIGWMKFVFQREGAAEGGLRLLGRRIGAEASDPRGVIRSQVPDGYGTAGIQATAIGFPAAGCWEIIAASGTSQLRFRTWVEIAPPTIGDLVGAPAPVVELAAPDGGRGALPVAADRPTVVTFWGSWCPSCTREPEALASVPAEAGVDVVLVAVMDVEAEVEAALAGSALPVLLDPDASAFAAYGGFGLPLSVFIDRDGVIRSFEAGPLTAESLGRHLAGVAPAAARFFSEKPGASGVDVWPAPTTTASPGVSPAP